MLANHRNVNKCKTDTLSGYDINYLNLWVAGWRGDPADLDKYMRIASSGYTHVPKKFRFTTTRVQNGICLDCNKPRCFKCNGCPIDIFKDDLETAHCQRCICLPIEESKPLNDTGIPLSELVRHRQGPGNKKNNGGISKQ